MASTSLAAQLKKLSKPQSSLYNEKSVKPSLLFNPIEAATKDRETFYEIGISGLKELIALSEDFSVFEDTLFSLSSKDFERAVQTQEVNENLDSNIEKFLLLCSPYLLLKSSHKAIEWLVNRYHIHEYNQDAIMQLILPYYDTKIFMRFFQIMDIKTHVRGNLWHWLAPIKQSGATLTKLALFNQCASGSSGLLQFITKFTLKYVKLYKEHKVTQLNTILAFFVSVSIGSISCAKSQAAYHVVLKCLPGLIKAVRSPIEDFRAAGNIVIGFVVSRMRLKETFINEIVLKIFTADMEISYESVLLLNLIYKEQNHLTVIPEEIMNNVSPDIMKNICGHLNTLAARNISIKRLLKLLIKSALPLIEDNLEGFQLFHWLPTMLIEEVNLKEQEPKIFIDLLVNSYKTTNKGSVTDSQKDAEDDGSDLEIIEDDDEFQNKQLQWYQSLLSSIERMYPNDFDKYYQTIKKDYQIGKSEQKQQFKLKLFSFRVDSSHHVAGRPLFHLLYNRHSSAREAAITYIQENFIKLKNDDPAFLKDTIIRMFSDDNPRVVNVALDTPMTYISSILTPEELTTVFTKIVSRDNMRNYGRWITIIHKAVKKFCTCDTLLLNQDTVLAIVPYMFPFHIPSAEVTSFVISSLWGRKFGLTKGLDVSNMNMRDNYLAVLQLTFSQLKRKDVSFDDILDIDTLDKNKTIDVCFYLLLKSMSFHKSSAKDLRASLNLLLETLEKRLIVPNPSGEGFTYSVINDFINHALQDKMLFEFVEYIFSKMIENINVSSVTKPWCNFCDSDETALVRQLYEICITGCFIEEYNTSYSKLLQMLFKRCTSNTREKFEFIANFACGHIAYAADPKDVISPDLQMRSFVLLKKCIRDSTETEWGFDSDVMVISLLFGLNIPLAVIRTTAVEIIEEILQKNNKKDPVYNQMLKELLERKEEMIIDHEQLPQILYNILTQSDPKKKVFKRNCLAKLLQNLTGVSHAHVSAELLTILGELNTLSVFNQIVPALNPIIQKLKSNKTEKQLLDVYESKFMRNILERVNETTITAISDDNVWKNIELCLKEHRECVLETDFSLVSPSVLALRAMQKNLWEKTPDNRSIEIMKLICEAGAISNNPSISSVAAKTTKKLHLQFKHFNSILQGMLNVEDPEANPKKKKSTVTMLSYQLAETKEWKMGVTILEYVQNKKKMTVDSKFVSLLFQILNRCLRFEEPSYVEYTKQLILSSLWFYCKNFVNDSDKDQVKALKSVFDIELVVQCIRNTQNPQTHHHALMLLSHAAYMMPEQVLHHTMEIFTFMGTSVLRHDDAYSFQIIIKIIETLIPILIKLDKDVDEYTGKQLEQLQNRVVPILRVFADAVLHVPEHRRLPLYKKLIETIGPNQFMWVFLGLLLETHVTHFNDSKDKEKRGNRSLADQEAPVNRTDFGQSILLEFPPESCIENFTRLIAYMKTLPVQKDENTMDTEINPSDIFSVNGHTALQLRHYKYVTITFLNSCLSSPRFIHHTSQASDVAAMEAHYKSFIVNVLTYIQNISKHTDEQTAKYWRVMLHHSYDLLDNTNNLLSVNMFLSVVRGLLKHTLPTVRRKAMELLNNKLQLNPDFFADSDKGLLFSLLPALMDIVKTIDTSEVTEDAQGQELELNQQTALLSLKLLTRMLAAESPEDFKPLLECITSYTCNQELSGNIMASVVLCLAELCGNMKAHALVSLWKFMPALIKVLKQQRKAETPELILLSTVTAVAKIVESLPLFLSPYLQKILQEYAILASKWQAYDQDCVKVSSIVSKLQNIKKKISTCIPPRVLIPVINQTHQALLEKEKYSAIGPVMSVLAESFANVTSADFKALQQDLINFFLSALQLRNDASEKGINREVINRAEDEVVNALVCLVLKLSEGNFRPFYFKVYDWAIRTPGDGQKDRAITFYRLSSAVGSKLKVLFVLFAGHFIKNSAELLDACNDSKTSQLYFESEDKCIDLINSILQTLRVVFLYDSQNFMNKERFETLMQSIVDQLENTVGGIEGLKSRATELIIPCVSQFAVATADDSLWKLLNYQILLKTRHNEPEIRLIALECLVAMATQLGSSWLPLLAESVPFLAELLEDTDAKIENATKKAIRKLEQILGEPLEKYF